MSDPELNDEQIAIKVMGRQGRTIDALRAEIARLRGALEWYANPVHYEPGVDLPAPARVDAGARARAALAESNGGEHG